jgi:hypothetical protein
MARTPSNRFIFRESPDADDWFCQPPSSLHAVVAASGITCRSSSCFKAHFFKRIDGLAFPSALCMHSASADEIAHAEREAAIIIIINSSRFIQQILFLLFFRSSSPAVTRNRRQHISQPPD